MNTYFEWSESNPDGLHGFWQIILAFPVPDDALKCKPFPVHPLRIAKIHDGENGKTAVCSFIVAEECVSDIPLCISYMKSKASQSLENAGIIYEPQQSLIEEALNELIKILTLKHKLSTKVLSSINQTAAPG